MGAFADIGPRLIEYGYGAIPIEPGTKKPGTLRNGEWVGLEKWPQRYKGRKPSKAHIDHWSKSGSGVGVICGVGGLIAVDIDTDVPEIRTALDAFLPRSPVRKIGKRGETVFFFAPHVNASKRWKIGEQTICELLGPGTQTVLPPTIHPDTGAPYRWSGTKSLDVVKPSDLPLLPTDIVDRMNAALAVFGCVAGEPRVADNADSEPVTDDDSPHRELNDAALADLDAWVPALSLCRCKRTRRGYEAVPTWRPSTKGLPDDKRGFSLGITPMGIRDFVAGQGHTPLDLVMLALGCDLDHAFGFLADQLGWSSSATIELHVDAAQPAVLAEPPPDPDPLIEYATNIPGVLGDIVDWVTVTARRPNRVLALGTAITVIGTLIGRRVAGPTRSATHLYVVGIGTTGAGKQHILDSAVRLLKAAGAGDHIGPSKFFSLSAVIDHLDYMPLALCPQDEIGVFLKAITNRRASSHEAAVSQVLRNMWNTSFAPLATPAWANRRTSLISCPAVSILGVSTPDEFFSALQGDSVNNGFLNRFLALQSNIRAVMGVTPVGPSVPDRLREALHALYLWSGPESLLQINDPKVEYPPDVLSWASTAAHTVYKDLEREVDRWMDEQPAMKPYIARVAEIAIRLATIRAAGRWCHGAKVDVSDMTWGAELAWKAGEAMADAMIDQVPQTDRGEFADKLLAVIRRRGSVTVRDIQICIRGRLRSAEIKDIVRQLIEAGEVEFADGKYRAV